MVADGDLQLAGQPVDRHRKRGGLDELDDLAQSLVAVDRLGHLTLPATMPSTIHRLRKKTISAGIAIATIAAALMIV